MRLLLVFAFILLTQFAKAQCSICTKTAAQLGEGPASALNGGIVYLMIAPLAVFFYLAFRWWKREKAFVRAEQEGTAIHEHA